MYLCGIQGSRDERNQLAMYFFFPFFHFLFIIIIFFILYFSLSLFYFFFPPSFNFFSFSISFFFFRLSLFVLRLKMQAHTRLMCTHILILLYTLRAYSSFLSQANAKIRIFRDAIKGAFVSLRMFFIRTLLSSGRQTVKFER